MLPDFLFIGAQRTASTWLFRNLRAHPQIWVPPNKSAVYFVHNFQKFRLKKAWYFRSEIFGLRTPARDRAYYLRYHLNPFPGDRWYASLFPDDPAIAKGEIAEDYSALSPEAVARVRRLMPDLRIIFVLRNPWERALSHAKLVFKRGRKPLSEATMADYLADIDSDISEKRTFYTRTLETWEAHYPKDRFLIGFYEDIQRDPFSFLEKICAFLEKPYDRALFEKTAPLRINTTETSEIPDDVVRHTVRKYREEAERLALRFGGPALEWREQADRILSNAP